MGRTGQPETPALDYRAEALERISEAAACLVVHLRDNPHDVHELSDIERAIVVDEHGLGRIVLAEREAAKRRPTHERREPKKRIPYPTTSEAEMDAGVGY